MTVPVLPPVFPPCSDLPVIVLPSETLNDAIQHLASTDLEFLVVMATAGPARLLSAQLLIRAQAKGAVLEDRLATIQLPVLPIFDINDAMAPLQQAFNDPAVECIGLCGSNGQLARVLRRDRLPVAITDIEASHTAMLAQAFQQSPAALVLSELETGIFVAVNQSFEDLTGYHRDRVLGYASTDINFYLHPAQRDALVRQLKQEKSVQGYELTIITLAGEAVSCLFSGCLLDSGGRTLVLSLLLDHRAWHQAQTELSQERSTLDTLLNTLPDLVWLKSAAGTYLRCNREFETLLGVDADLIVGSTDFELFDIEDAKRFRCNDQAAIESSQKLISEHYIAPANDGQQQVYESIKTALHDDRGQLMGVLGVARNVSARRKAEQALTAERDLFAGGPVAVMTWTLSRHRQLSYASPNIHTIFGYSARQLCAEGFSYNKQIHPHDLNQVGQQVSAHLLALTESWELRYRVRHQNGAYLWLFEHVVVERSSTSDQVLLRSYVMDDSERVAAENRLRLAASVFDHAHEGILVTDAQQNIVEVNPMFCEITGYQRSDVLGLNPRVLNSGRQSADFYRTMWEALLEQGHWCGEIHNRRKDGQEYTARIAVSAIYDEQNVLVNYVSVFADITQIKRHQAKLELLAHYDSLTGLPNRVLLAEQLTQALADADKTGTRTAVCYLDLDGFKPVNDRFGHDMGDRLLVEISNRLQHQLAEGDCVARLGGDEFVLLLNGLEGQQDCRGSAEKILSAISLPMVLEQRDFQLSASMGITLYPDDPADEDLLLRHADQAMYQAKMAGRNQYYLYDPSHDAKAMRKREATNRIRQALEQQELVLYLQPKVDLAQVKVIGFEALIRWQHPDKGLLLPAEFLPLVEGDSLAVEIDHWVLEQAFSLQQRWLSSGSALQIGVNLTGATLLGDGFITCLQRYIAEYPQAAPGLIEFEVLETSALEDIDHAEAVFTACEALGFTIALDDFGTGYSSLTYFRRLPAGTLKIDQSFVRDMLTDPEDLAIVESVIGLGQAFNRQLVAEGVESAEHGRLLVQLGCTVVQGFGIARPMPIDKALIWAKHWQPEEGWTVKSGILPPEHRVLVVAEKEHIEWRSRLLAQLASGQPDKQQRYGDYHSCRFGRWYYGLGRIHLGHHHEYKQLEVTHTRLHQLAQQTVIEFETLKPTERQSRQTELNQLAEQLQQQIDGLKMLIHHTG